MGFKLQKAMWAVSTHSPPSVSPISQHVNHASVSPADRLPFLQQSRDISGRLARFQDHAVAFVVEEGADFAGAGGLGGEVELRDDPIR